MSIIGLGWKNEKCLCRPLVEVFILKPRRLLTRHLFVALFNENIFFKFLGILLRSEECAFVKEDHFGAFWVFCGQLQTEGLVLSLQVSCFEMWQQLQLFVFQDF